MGGIESQHVRSDWVGAGLRKTLVSRGTAQIEHIRRRGRGGVRAVEIRPCVDVDRSTVRFAKRVRLIDQPHFEITGRAHCGAVRMRSVSASEDIRVRSESGQSITASYFHEGIGGRTVVQGGRLAVMGIADPASMA